MSGYRFISVPHVCGRPEAPVPYGTVIECTECRTRWQFSWLGWVKVVRR